jgi:hypothetical protein
MWTKKVSSLLLAGLLLAGWSTLAPIALISGYLERPADAGEVSLVLLGCAMAAFYALILAAALGIWWFRKQFSPIYVWPFVIQVFGLSVLLIPGGLCAGKSLGESAFFSISWAWFFSIIGGMTIFRSQLAANTQGSNDVESTASHGPTRR